MDAKYGAVMNVFKLRHKPLEIARGQSEQKPMSAFRGNPEDICSH
jgi:hypothetical protein